MPLAAGTRLGPYEIISALGAGGMGEVYRARDPRMGREVAIKIAAEQFSERFSREVHAVAALNHPNICHLYDVGPNYLVMELVDGPTLADRIKLGPVPPDEALAIAKQIADAFEAAHEKGIVHRDLKPANVKIKPDGTVKVLDFGLAKMADPPEASGARPEQSPTLTIDAATRVGMILGTAAYMSPEQARGKPVDKRADIWAFGVVLYEMLTGRRLFEGETVSDTLIEVATKEPDLSRIPATPGKNTQKLLRRCLAKDPKKRLRDIGEAWFLMEDTGDPAPASAASPSQAWRYVVAIAVLIALISALIMLFALREKPPAPGVTRFQVPLPEKAAFYNYVGISPDGRKLAFTATGPDGRYAIWVRSLEGLESRMLAGTVGMIGVPFWSPDSRYLGFGTEGKLKIVDVSGGPPRTVCDTKEAVVGGFWTGDGRIVFGSAAASHLLVVPVAGGVASPLTALDTSRQETLHNLPSPLPDGRHFLYYRRSSRAENEGVYIGSLDAKPEAQSSQILLASPVAAMYAPVPGERNGRILFLRDGTLMAQPFDASKLALTGEPVAMAEHVGSYLTNGLFHVSSNRVLVYRGGGISNTQLTWFDRQGKALGVEGDPGIYFAFALSPDGARVAMERIIGENNRDIWIHDRGRGAATRFTFDPAFDRMPVWSPDGSHIVFTSNRDGAYNLYQKLSSGAGEDELLFESGRAKYPSDWSPDGRILLYSQYDPKTQSDLWALPMTGDRKPVPVLQTQFTETQGQFSPDSRWIAYTSDESGKAEIYVRPFPPSSSSGKWMVSNDGGMQARWRRDGKELLYVSADRKLMSVDVTTGASFKYDVPKELFPLPIVQATSADFRWDMSADGKQFLVNTAASDIASEPITVVLNWTAGLKK